MPCKFREKVKIAELRAAFLAIANTLRSSASPARYRCTGAWIRRVRDMNERALSREMHFLLNRTALRRIARVFRNSRTFNLAVNINYACNISRLQRTGFFPKLCAIVSKHTVVAKKERFVCPYRPRGSFFQLYALKHISIKFRPTCSSIRHLYPFGPREASCGGVS